MDIGSDLNTYIRNENVFILCKQIWYLKSLSDCPLRAPEILISENVVKIILFRVRKQSVRPYIMIVFIVLYGKRNFLYLLHVTVSSLNRFLLDFFLQFSHPYSSWNSFYSVSLFSILSSAPFLLPTLHSYITFKNIFRSFERKREREKKSAITF